MMRMPPPVALTGDPDERNYKSPKFTMGSLSTITLYHDYICPWCYVGFFQAVKLTETYGVTFDWRGAELLPPGMELPPPAPPKPVDPDAPPAPVSRFQKFAAAEDLLPPSPRPEFARSHLALLGQEFAWRLGYDAVMTYNEAVYRGYWEQRENIADPDVLTRLVVNAGLNGAAFAEAIAAERDVDCIVPYDDDAYATGIRHLPLFLFGAEELLTEAPYLSLAAACENFLVRSERYKTKG